jgi:hypothetical protein
MMYYRPSSETVPILTSTLPVVAIGMKDLIDCGVRNPVRSSGIDAS